MEELVWVSWHACVTAGALGQNLQGRGFWEKQI